MREELAKLKGLRRTFKGTFVRFGSRSGFKHPLVTILLTDIIDIASGRVVSDHVWFTVGKRFNEAGLREGDVVQFKARVTTYLKGYQGRREIEENPVELDYRLSFPTDVKNMSQAKANNQATLL
jgi:hypothetical protein